MSDPRKRIPYGSEIAEHRRKPVGKCHDCGVSVGELHQEGCDWEECETCGAQRIGCSCCVVCRAHEKDGTWCVCGNCIDLAQQARVVRAAPREPSPDLAELITAARFALKECEEITSCYPNAGDFWGLADNAAIELRRALAGEQVSAFAKAVCAPPQVDVERLNRAVDTMMEQAKNLREVLAGRGAGHPEGDA